MNTVTHWQFIRLLGSTLSLAISATIINNSLRATMSALGLAPRTIAAIVADPTILRLQVPAGSSDTGVAVSAALARRILAAYVRGFRTVFVLGAALCAGATVVAVVLIRHVELARGDGDEPEGRDEGVLRRKALGLEEAALAEERIKASVGECGAPGTAGLGAFEKDKRSGEENV